MSPSLLRALQTHNGWMLSDALTSSDNSADDCGLNPTVYRGTVKQWRQTSFEKARLYLATPSPAACPVRLRGPVRIGRTH